MAEEPKPQSQETLADVDKLLGELDPEFSQQMGVITQDIVNLKEAPGLESVSLSAEYFKEGEAKVEDIAVPAQEPIVDQESTEVALQHSILEIAFDFAVQSTRLVVFSFMALFSAAIKIRKNGIGSSLTDFGEQVSPHLQKWLVPLQGLVKKLQSLETLTYFKIVSIIALVWAIRFIAGDMIRNHGPEVEKDPFLGNWKNVAGHVINLPAEEDEESLENPVRHPEYTVLVHRIIANLRPPTPKASPMVTAELYLEASNQDCAIELHERELEVKDAVSRVLEDMTFDELDKPEGKERLKIRIRTTLNKFLNKGHVKRIFFSAFNIHP